VLLLIGCPVAASHPLDAGGHAESTPAGCRIPAGGDVDRGEREETTVYIPTVLLRADVPPTRETERQLGRLAARLSRIVRRRRDVSR
jgi:hypothetical protein